ncbi:small polypeptide DEVIL 13-like [Impatiens glandulifera]|uniref:small polypeptide DEVIL 13-like n=1 Tax=Impatiens glandulifera TaxID=253017 RepID=UPI001FB18AC7|nr:small polypeptide DEVIL 13-like [Impatiens glandulifera]
MGSSSVSAAQLTSSSSLKKEGGSFRSWSSSSRSCSSIPALGNGNGNGNGKKKNMVVVVVESINRSSSSSSSSRQHEQQQQRRRQRSRCSFSRKCARLFKEQRARFYIMRRCVTMLICWREYADS